MTELRGVVYEMKSRGPMILGELHKEVGILMI